MPGNPARRGRPMGSRRHGVEPLEGRQLLSGLSSSDSPSIPRPAASWAIVSELLPSEGDRTSLIAELNSSTQDGSLASILSGSVGLVPSVPVGDRIEALAAREALSAPSLVAAKPMDVASSGDGHGAVQWPGANPLFQGQSGGAADPDGWTAPQVDHAFSTAGTNDPPPFFGPLGDPSPFPGPFHGEPGDWFSSRTELVDLLFTAEDPSSSPSPAGPAGGGIGFGRGPEDFAIGATLGAGTGRGILRELSNQSGLTPPTPLGTPLAQGPAGDGLPRNNSTGARPEVAEAPHGEVDAPDKAKSIDESIDEVIAEGGTALSRGADLLASFSPFDRVALEHTIDHFLGQIDDLGAVLSHLEVTASLLPNLMATASVIVAAEAIRRRVRGPSEEQGEDPHGDGDAAYPGLPGLPRGWTLEEL